MTSKWKLAGALVAIAGALLTCLGNVIEDKKMEETIEEKVNEALAQRETEES